MQTEKVTSPLLIGLGDGGSGGDPERNGQNLEVLLGGQVDPGGFEDVVDEIVSVTDDDAISTLEDSAASTNVLVGDASAGAAFFNDEGKCATCHTATTLSLAGIGADQTRIRIIVVPSGTRNVHDIDVSGEFSG